VKSRHKVATPIPGGVEIGVDDPNSTPMSASPRKKKKASKKKDTKQVSYNVVIDRIAMVLNYLRDDYDVFMLGGASPHMQHQVFLAGAKWTDTSAWRVKAVLGEIYIPDHSSGHSSFGIGYSQKHRECCGTWFHVDDRCSICNKKGKLKGPKRMDTEALEILKDCLDDPRHPFTGMYWKRFMEIGHMLVPQWRKKVLKHNYEADPFVLKALHNAYVLKCVEEETANEYVNDPDRYYHYIKKRLAPRKILSNRLKGLWRRIKSPYVQDDLRVYMKMREKK
jgi:hypothetical protein